MNAFVPDINLVRFDSCDEMLVSVDEMLIMVMAESILEGEFVLIASVLFFCLNEFQDVDDSIYFGPHVGLELGKDQHVINVDFEGP